MDHNDARRPVLVRNGGDEAKVRRQLIERGRDGVELHVRRRTQQLQ